MMKIYLLSLLLGLSWGASAEKAGASASVGLIAALENLQDLERELGLILAPKFGDCQETLGGAHAKPLCSLRDFCARSEVQKDHLFLYENAQGKKIINGQLLLGHEEIRRCLMEKHAGEIEEKRGQKLEELKLSHLLKVKKAKKDLDAIAVARGEKDELMKVSYAFSALVLEEGFSQKELQEAIGEAEKTAGISLDADVKKALIHLHDLKAETDYQGELEQFEESLFPALKNPDPLYDWTLLTDEKKAGGRANIEKNRKQMMEKTKEAYALFTETKKAMLGYLNDQKKKGVNGAGLARIIKRVETLRFGTPRLTETVQEQCKIPDAFYNPLDHSLTLCPQMLNYPVASLVETMAHEMAHSFDSCNLSAQMVKVKVAEMEEAPFDLDIEMERIPGSYALNLEGHFSPAQVREPIQGIMLYKDHPFAQTLSCLKSSESVGALGLDKGKIVAKAKGALAQIKQQKGDTSKMALARKIHYLLDNASYFDQFLGCDTRGAGDVLGRSQEEEAFATQVSAEIVARMMAKMPREKAEQFMLEVALNYDNICQEESAGEQKIKEFLKKEGCRNYMEGREREKRILDALNIVDPSFERHIDNSRALERIHLAHPLIQKALGCGKKKGVKYCE